MTTTLRAVSAALLLPALFLTACGQESAKQSEQRPPPPVAETEKAPSPKKAKRRSLPDDIGRLGDESEEMMSEEGPVPSEPGLAGGAPPPPPAALPPEADEETTRSMAPEAPAGGAAPGEPSRAEKPAAPSPSSPPRIGVVEGEAFGDAWDVVPVFYGTDRDRIAGPSRLYYGDRRARRLELGRALVTVPKSHTVPQIERPWTMHVFGIQIGERENPKEHFTMKEVKALSQAEFLSLVGERLAASSRYRNHALIFVHGFNTDFDYAVYRTAQIAYDLKFDGASFAYSWPSGSGVLNYTYDRESSGQALPYLKEFISLVLKRTGAEQVSLIAHSMGNQPVLQVLKDLRAAKPEGVTFDQIILAAPDVDRDNFENIAAEIRGLAKGVTLYAAKNDKALAISRNVNGGVPRAGDVPAGGPLVLEGIDTIDVTSVSTDSFGLNHSGYAENNDLLKDVRQLIETGVRPPEKRIVTTRPVTSAKGLYWQYMPIGDSAQK